MQDALLYSTANEMQRRDAELALTAVIPLMKWKASERIVDVGSGSGDITVSLLSKQIPVEHQLVGLDCSEEMVSFANNNHANINISFHCLNIEKVNRSTLTFPDRFHKLFSLYCLHWVKDLDQAVQNMKDLLIDGGEALLLFIASNPIFRMYCLMAKKSKWASYMKDYKKYVPVYQDKTNPDQRFRSILNNHGLEVKMCEAKEHSYEFKSQQRALQAVTAVNPFIKRIPEASRQEFMSDCLTTLLSIMKPSADGRINARYTLMAVHFKKPRKHFR